MKVKIKAFSRGQWREKIQNLADVIAQVRDRKYEKLVLSLRDQLQVIIEAEGEEAAAGELTELTGVEGLPQVLVPTGMTALLLPVESQEHLAQLRRRVSLFPQVATAFLSVSARSLQVVMCFERPDGTLPETPREAALFQQYAYRRAADFVLAATGVKAVEQDVTKGQWIYLSSDAEASWNPHPTAVVMEQPTEELTEQTAAIMPCGEGHTMERNVLPGFSQLEMDITKFNAVCRRLAFGPKRTPDEYLLALATACRKAGIDQEVATKCLLNLGDYWDKEPLVRSTMENAYLKHRYGLKSPIEPSLMHQQLMKDFLLRRYVFRRNVVTGDVEYQEKGRYILSWRPLTSEARNDINNAAIDEGIKVWPQDMDRLLASSQVDDYDPVREWLGALPPWDGRDRLGEMADRVPTRFRGWRDNFKVWMRSMVSQWTSGAGRMYGAQMVLMLVGAQGTRKSTFLRMLLPEELHTFYIDRIDFTNKKEALRALSRFLLINIDEYDQVSPSQTAYLKHLIQRTDVKERRMYETIYQQLQRYAAFCATTNSLTPLKDDSGSRRYMVVEVTGVIDTDQQGDHQIDYPQLYAQIKEELRRGEPSYFDGERERLIVEQGADFYATPNVISMFCDHFRKPQAGDEPLLMTPTEVLVHMRDTWHIDLINQSNAVLLGNYLHREQFERGKGADRRKYLMSVSCQS